jgi:hypothetical protein
MSIVFQRLVRPVYFTYVIEYFDGATEEVKAIWPKGAKAAATGINPRWIHGPKEDSMFSQFMRYLVDRGNIEDRPWPNV